MSLDHVGLLIEQCNHQAARVHRSAVIYKWVGNLGNFLVVSGTITSGFLSLYDPSLSIPVSVFSFGTALVKSLMVYYSPEKRALALAGASIENAKVARKLRELDVAHPNMDQVKGVINEAYSRLDELKLLEFGGGFFKEHGSPVDSGEV